MPKFFLDSVRFQGGYGNFFCCRFSVYESNIHSAATSPAKEKSRGNIVPHEENRGKTRVYKVGRRNAFTLPPQLSNQGPLTHGPFTCQPPHTTTWRHPGVHVDSRGLATCPRHLRTTSAHGSALLCHVALRAMSHPRRPRVPRQLRGSCGDKKPPFLYF